MEKCQGFGTLSRIEPLGLLAVLALAH
ncbi:MAG: hypothetical protein RLZZ573_587, partial [Pseudomonadota bacterium]